MKIAIVLNRRHDLPTQLNAVGHASVGLAHQVRADQLALRDFRDASGWAVSQMTDHPLIVFSARSSAHLAEAHAAARAASLPANAFFSVMKSDTPEEQEHQIGREPAADQDYVALALFGDDADLRPLTRRFSLFRAEALV